MCKKDMSIKIKIIFVCAFLLFISGCAAKTPLIKASEEGDTFATEKLISEGANIDESDEDGYTPLMHAIWSGRAETVKLLIKKGADVNAKDRTSYTPLLWASYYGHLDIANLLIDKGANINVRGNDKSSPLLLASAANYNELSALLIKKGADVNVRDASGATALHYHNLLMIVQHLLDRNADTTLKNEQGWTALRKAIYEKNIGKVALIRKKTNWQGEIYDLTSEEIIGRSIYEPEKDMFDVPPEKERAYKLATHDCNTMLFKNLSAGGLLLELNLYGIPTLARMASNAYRREEFFQQCMAIMGFECKNNCPKNINPARFKEVVDSPPIEEPLPKQNVQSDENNRTKNQNLSQQTKKEIKPHIKADPQYNQIKGIVLTSGNVIEGQILNISANAVIIRTKDGKVLSYSFEKEVRGFVK
jgi:hypothetical protein